MNAGQVQIEAVKGLYFRAVEATVQRAVLPLYQEAGLPLPQGEAGKEQASHGRYTTDWLREAPYSLAELAAFVPTGWRRPLVQPQTMYGRNDALFRAGMKWSGAPRNWGNWAGLGLTLRVWNTLTEAGRRAAAGGKPAPARRQAPGILHAAACRHSGLPVKEPGTDV